MGLLGAHMSIAGGLYKAIERGDALTCEAIQIFTQSSRTWAISPLTEQDTSDFKNAMKAAKTVKKVVAHNSYLLNLSTANEEQREKSVEYCVTTMNRCEALGVEGLITHPGSHQGAGMESGIQMTAKSVDEILKATKGFKTKFILENTAGQGGCVGHDFHHFEAIADQVSDPDRIYYCFDTQHAFAAGYDLRTPEGYEDVLTLVNKTIGTKKIVSFHLNDALKDFNCRVDRHQSIGKGFLGKEAFRPLVNDPRFAQVPMCLETDPGEDNKNYRRELKVLRGLM